MLVFSCSLIFYEKKKKYCRLLKCLKSKLNLVWFFITLIFFTAKDLIRGLLKTVPEERLSIEDVMRNKWVAVSHLFCYFYIISLFTMLSEFFNSIKFISYLVTFFTKSCWNEMMIIFFPEGQHNHFHDILYLMNVFDSE